MNIPFLDDSLAFPDVWTAIRERNGLVAIGGDLSVKRLILAYRNGIFPWFSEGEPICWWCLNPRMVLLPENLHIPRSLGKKIRNTKYRITSNYNFAATIRNCAQIKRSAESGTWITPSMQRAYIDLHKLGIAHSFEYWYLESGEYRLGGGFYGVQIGGVFCGESMFALVPDASKIAFALGVEYLARQGIEIIDCQMHTEHLARFGAKEIDFAEFEQYLKKLRDLEVSITKQVIHQSFL